MQQKSAIRDGFNGGPIAGLYGYSEDGEDPESCLRVRFSGDGNSTHGSCKLPWPWSVAVRWLDVQPSLLIGDCCVAITTGPFSVALKVFDRKHWFVSEGLIQADTSAVGFDSEAHSGSGAVVVVDLSSRLLRQAECVGVDSEYGRVDVMSDRKGRLDVFEFAEQNRCLLCDDAITLEGHSLGLQRLHRWRCRLILSGQRQHHETGGVRHLFVISAGASHLLINDPAESSGLIRRIASPMI